MFIFFLGPALRSAIFLFAPACDPPFDSTVAVPFPSAVGSSAGTIACVACAGGVSSVADGLFLGILLRFEVGCGGAGLVGRSRFTPRCINISAIDGMCTTWWALPICPRSSQN